MAQISAGENESCSLTLDGYHGTVPLLRPTTDRGLRPKSGCSRQRKVALAACSVSNAEQPATAGDTAKGILRV